MSAKPNKPAEKKTTKDDKPGLDVSTPNQTEFEKAGMATLDGLVSKSGSNGNPQLKFATGHKGLGVLIDTIGGDVNGNVFVRECRDGVVTEVIIRTLLHDPKDIGKERLVGTVCVDGGQILIVDPCYILPH